MKIIIDTHIFLWAIGNPSLISDKKRMELETLANTIYVSSISTAEIMIKSSLGKLNVSFDLIEMMTRTGFEHLDFTSADAVLLQNMPFHHKDPFDRMLIAQAISNKAVLMTDDGKFRDYDCKLI